MLHSPLRLVLFGVGRQFGCEVQGHGRQGGVHREVNKRQVLLCNYMLFRIHSWHIYMMSEVFKHGSGSPPHWSVDFRRAYSWQLEQIRKIMVHILPRWPIRQNEEGASIYSAKFSRSRLGGEIRGFHIRWGRGQRRSWFITAKSLLNSACLPKNIIMDRHVFNTTNQKPGESIQSYVS